MAYFNNRLYYNNNAYFCILISKDIYEKMRKSNFIKVMSVATCALVMILSVSPLAAQDKNECKWVDSVYNSLTVRQRVAQLMVVRANTPVEAYKPDVMRWIREYNIGGLCVFQPADSSIAALVEQLNLWQSVAQTPLLMTIDGETGVAWRLKNSPVLPFPYQLTLGAVAENSLIYQMGVAVAEQCLRLGFTCDFAPVVDVNNNPNNPVIGVRSFGSNPMNVAHKGAMYALGMQSLGLITTMKHFPGHGKTGTDSHYSLPVIKHAADEVETVELVPFRYLIDKGVAGCMVGHLYFEALEPDVGLSSSLSYNIVTTLLKEKMGFKGLVVTDGLDMKGVMADVPSDSVPYYAFLAGNDVLLLPSNVDKAIEYIYNLVNEDENARKILETSCKKVLTYKYRAGLSHYVPQSMENVVEDVNKKKYAALIQKLYDEALTVLKNEKQLFPLEISRKTDVACLTIGNGRENGVYSKLTEQGVKVTAINVSKDDLAFRQAELMQQLSAYDVVLVNVQNTNQLLSKNKDYAITPETVSFVDSLSKQNPVILNLFACPYALDRFDLSSVSGIIVAYEDNAMTEDAVVRALCGQLKAQGRLPVDINGYAFGSGM